MNSSDDHALPDDVLRMKNDSGLQSLQYLDANRAAALADLHARWPLLSETAGLLRANAVPLRFGSRQGREQPDP